MAAAIGASDRAHLQSLGAPKKVAATLSVADFISALIITLIYALVHPYTIVSYLFYYLCFLW